MKKIKHICCKCGSDNIDVMSVREKVLEEEGKQAVTADITYICADCGNAETENHHLYKSHRGKKEYIVKKLTKWQIEDSKKCDECSIRGEDMDCAFCSCNCCIMQ